MSPRILFVDDEPDLRDLLNQKFRRQLREGKFNFVFAYDGVEALDAVAGDEAIELVVSDINMPRMDGLTLLDRLQDVGRQMSTVIVSAYGDMGNIRTAMNRGAFDFLTKPIDFVDLEATISKTLKHIGTLREARRRQNEAERAHAALSRYFSPSLAERLANDSDSLSLAGQRRDVAALFTDIEGFTTLAEAIATPTLSALLNGYLSGMTSIVFSHEGTVARVNGDALHVLFGAPGDQPDHATRAVACALDLDAFAQSFRETWRAQGVALGVTRIGVNAGPAIVGNFGGGRYFDYTAYGDTINVASRLEVANKELGTRICVSESVRLQVPGFLGRPVGDLLIRGRAVSLRAYEPQRQRMCLDSEVDGYLHAFAKMEAGDPGALGAFAAEVSKHPDDPLANFHLRRLLNGAAGTITRLA